MTKQHEIAIVTDSTCDLPEQLIEEHGITLVPLYIQWGGASYRDRVEMTAADFYERLVHDPAHPSTAQATPGDFVEVYRRAQRQGAREIVCITISSAMSGTHSAALQAAEMVDLPVHLVDARGPTMSVGWQVLAAARVRQAGGAAREMLSAADHVRATITQHVLLDTLEFLHKGGRIGGAARFVGSLLNLKPIITINHDTGQVEAGQRVRTRGKALDAFLRGFVAALNPGQRPMHLALLHGNALADAEALAERIRSEFHPLELLIGITSPVLGVHTGPGALCLCGYLE